MQLQIGKNIKQLRKEKDITQEEFAEQIGVSNQSVSRWENGVCYPDVELLPTIAGCFGVTVDRLLGADDETERKRTGEYLSAFQSAISRGRIDECIRIARAGVAEYPNNEQLLNKLMYALFVSGDDSGNIPDWEENMRRYDDEIVRLGERLMRTARDADIRFEAVTRLAFQHHEMGRKEKSREIFAQIPTIPLARESFLWFALEPEERLPFVRQYINDSYHALNHAMCLLAEEQLIPDEQVLRVFEKTFAIDGIVFDGLRGKDSPWYIAESRTELAKVCARLGKLPEMYRALREAAESVKAFDERPDRQTYETLLLGRRTVDRENFDTADTRPLREIFREDWLAAKEFDAVRETEAFRRILQELE